MVKHSRRLTRLSLLSVAVAQFAHADVVSWKTFSSGDWTAGSNWSTGNIPDSTDQALISVVGGYTITINTGTTSVTAGSVLFNASAARLLLSQGTFSAPGGMQINAGTFLINGGTLRNTILSGNGRVDAWRGGFDNVSIGGTVHVINNYPAAGGGAPFHIGGGLNLSNGLLDIYTSGNDNQWAIAQFNGTQSITGSGSISLDGTRAARLFLNGGTTTLTSGIQLRGVGTITATNATLVNQGTIEAAPAPAFLRFLSSSWSATPLLNQGTIQAGAGAGVYLEQRINNSAGTIQSTGGTVFIGSDNGNAPVFSTSTLGTLLPGTGTISLRGSWDNAGRTLTVPAGNAFECVGTFSGGTLTGSAPSAPIFGNVTLKNLAIKGQVNLKELVKLEAITFDNGTLSLQGADQEFAQCVVSTPQALNLTGNGTIRFDGSFSSNEINAGGTLTFGPGIKVQSGLSGGTINGYSNPVINSGTIASDTSSIHVLNLRNQGRLLSSGTGGLFLNTLNNSGTISSSGGTLSFSGVWSNSGVISSDNAGTVVLGSMPTSAGTVNITDSTLYLRTNATTAQLKQFSISQSSVHVDAGARLDHAGQTWDTGINPLFLSDGTLSGGTASSSSTGDLTIVPGKLGVIENVTVSGPARLNVQGTMRGNVKLNGATLSIGSPTGSEATADFTGPLEGNGEIVFNATTGIAGLMLPTTDLTIPSGITVRTGTSGGYIGNGFGVLTNNGSILINNPAAQVTLETASSINNTPSFVNNSTVSLSSGTWDLRSNTRNDGTFLVTGGVGTLATRITGAGTIEVRKGTVFLSTLSQRALNVGSMGSAIFRLTGGGNGSELLEELTLAFGGVVDLGNHNLAVNYSGASPYSALLAAVKSGFAGGSWNGSGIISKNAADRSASSTRTGIALMEANELFTSFPASWKGQSIDATTILMQYALPGDIDLNAKVNTLDFNRFVTFFGGSTSLWTRGDFNYDGNVTSIDFNLLLTNYGRSTPFSAQTIGAVVPEPSVACVLAGLGLLRLRKHPTNSKSFATTVK